MSIYIIAIASLFYFRGIVSTGRHHHRSAENELITFTSNNANT